jgi:hypothetical protein
MGNCLPKLHSAGDEDKVESVSPCAAGADVESGMLGTKGKFPTRAKAPLRKELSETEVSEARV